MNASILLISCEHAVNTVPADLAHCFRAQPEVLNTHRGIDFGALEMARDLSQAFASVLFTASVSRLLIECNRSLNHPNLFSEFSANLSEQERQRVINTWYQPYRRNVREQIQAYIRKGHPVWHLSMHSFTPVWNGITRNADIGLLYDPKRPAEKHLAQQWQPLLQKGARTRRNYPYRGNSDGFTTSLRKEFPDEWYLGMEIEVNQALAMDAQKRASITELLIRTLRTLR